MMKRILKWLAPIACVAMLATSCYKGWSPSGDQSGAIYGQWLLDTKTVIIDASAGVEEKERKDIVDFTGTGCYLELNPELSASAKLGTDLAVTTFSYDAESKRIDFPRGLSVADYEKKFELVGSYDVTTVTEDKLVLSQQAIGITFGAIKANETINFTFHRKEQPNGSKEKQ